MDVLERMKERLGGPPSPTEDDVTKSIEQYTAGIPSSAFLATALGAMLLSMLGPARRARKVGKLCRPMGTDDPDARCVQQARQARRT